MASLLTKHHDFADPSSFASPSADLIDLNAPARRSALMRKYEVAALMPDLSIFHMSQIAPATKPFEDTASAFARGTLIQTVNGPVAVEDLLPGDYVETPRGAEPVLWIGSTAFVPNLTAAESTLSALTRVTAEAFGPARPSVDMVLGPAARFEETRPALSRLIGHCSVLVPVEDYHDGDRLFPVTPGGAVQLYHIALQRHGTIRVGGLSLETYHPGAAIKRELSAGIWPLFLALFPNRRGFEEFGELTLPRTSRAVLEGLGHR